MYTCQVNEMIFPSICYRMFSALQIASILPVESKVLSLFWDLGGYATSLDIVSLFASPILNMDTAAGTFEPL